MTTKPMPVCRALVIVGLLASAVLGSACNLLPGGAQTLTLNVDGVTVTCRLNTSSIEGNNPYGPGSEAESQCRARARDAMGTLLATQHNAEIQSVDIASDGATTVCFTNAGASSCQQILPALQNGLVTSPIG